MRMPIFSYFLVVGALLTALLIWFGDDGDLQSAPLRTSQQIGIPKPFKGKPESMPDITNANFAAARERPAAERERAPEKPAKVAAQPKPRHRTVARTWQQPPPPRSWFAEYPHAALMGFH
jgi:hypothetical protein